MERLLTDFSHVMLLSFGFRARSYFHVIVSLLPKNELHIMNSRECGVDVGFHHVHTLNALSIYNSHSLQKIRSTYQHDQITLIRQVLCSEIVNK